MYYYNYKINKEKWKHHLENKYEKKENYSIYGNFINIVINTPKHLELKQKKTNKINIYTYK